MLRKDEHAKELPQSKTSSGATSFISDPVNPGVTMTAPHLQEDANASTMTNARAISCFSSSLLWLTEHT